MSFNQGSRKKTVAPMLSVRDGRPGQLSSTKHRLEPRLSCASRITQGQRLPNCLWVSPPFWLADESPEHQNFSSETLGG